MPPRLRLHELVDLSLSVPSDAFKAIFTRSLTRQNAPYAVIPAPPAMAVGVT